MTQETQNLETDTIIGRIIDGEASRDDLKRFESMARDDSGLWQRLALRQIDMSALKEQVLETTAVAEGVDARPRAAWHRTNFAVALSGWAAVLLLLAAWWVVSGPARQGVASTWGVDDSAVAELTADEHLQKYMEADFVVGEHDLVMLDQEKIEGGLHRVRFIRRIEEYVDIAASPRTIVDARGRLTKDPARLRRSAARRGSN
jgi:hypothetical protein